MRPPMQEADIEGRTGGYFIRGWRVGPVWAVISQSHATGGDHQFVVSNGNVIQDAILTLLPGGHPRVRAYFDGTLAPEAEQAEVLNVLGEANSKPKFKIVNDQFDALRTPDAERPKSSASTTPPSSRRTVWPNS